MRLVVGSFALVLGVAMLLPAASVPAALAQDASASPSASVEPSGSATADVSVELVVEPGDPALEWAITVTGGSPSVDVLELREIEIGSHGVFTIAMDGPSATVEMTPALPPGWELIMVGCLNDLDPPTEIDPLVEPGGFVLEVVTGRSYSCFPTSFPLETPDPANPTDPTLPPTDTLAGLPPVPVSEGLPIILAAMVGAIAGSLLLGVRARR